MTLLAGVRRRARAQSVSWLVFCCFAGVLGVWSLATPLWSTPDAMHHDLTAYAFGHGDLTPEQTTEETNGVNTNAVTHAPRGIVRSANSAGCLNFHPDTPASCMKSVGEAGKQAKFINSAARNFPLYYTLTGLASNIGDNLQALYLQRLAAVLLVAWLLTWAVSGARRLRRPGIAVTGVLLSLTPMLAYLGGAVNPNSFEIASAYALAACSLAFYALRGTPDGERMFRRAMVAATILGSTRILGPVWLGVWALALLILYGRGAVTAAWKARSRWWALAPVIGVVANMAWLRHSGVDNIRTVPLFDLPLIDRLRASAAQVNGSLSQVVGHFGWLDTPLPVNLVIAYAALVSIVVGLTWAALRPRDIAAAATVIALSWLLPVLLQAWKWNLQGAVWQGRYLLPTLGMAPILMMCVAAQAPVRDQLWNSRTVRWTRVGAVAGLAALHFWAFRVLMDRNVRGLEVGGESPNRLPNWQPPLGETFLTLALIGSLIVALALLARMPMVAMRDPSIPAPPVRQAGSRPTSRDSGLTPESG